MHKTKKNASTVVKRRVRQRRLGLKTKTARGQLISTLMCAVASLDLDKMAKQRGVVKGRQNTLECLAKVVLGVAMEKGSVRTSKWSSRVLTAEQQTYAALDVTVPIQIYRKLLSLPDLTVRLTGAEAAAGVDVDVVPPSGSLVTMATRSATGKVTEALLWAAPPWSTTTRACTPALTRMVQVTVVHASGCTSYLG